MTKQDILRNVNGYEIDVLADRVLMGFLTFDELCSAGLHHTKRTPLKEKLEVDAWQKCEQENSEEAYKLFAMHYPLSQYAAEAKSRYEQMLRDAGMEEEYWKNAQTDNTVGAYKLYLNKYPSGKYVSSAQFKMEMIEQEELGKKNQLLDEMRYYPNQISEPELASIIQENKYGITPQDLIEQGIISPNALNAVINGVRNRIKMPQRKWEELPTLPKNTTDVYFFGVPLSGKSCVLAGFLSAANQQGFLKYNPYFTEEGVDPCQDYYYGLMECVENHVTPDSTASDTCNFMSLSLMSENGNKQQNDLTFIEIGGEYFLKTTEVLGDAAIREQWESVGATDYLKSENRKMMFFVIDYSIASGQVANITNSKQAQALERAVTVFNNDGRKQGVADCTFSKTDTIIVIVTKADLMPAVDKDERNIIARDYLNAKHKNFMENLRRICQSFNINAATGNKPIITTFSIGNFMAGNTFEFVPNDSEDLVEIVRNYSRAQKNGGVLHMISKLFSLG